MIFRFILLVLLAASAFADQIILANGDRLSGRIQKLDAGKMTVITDMAGPLVIPWPNVGTITSAQPLYVMLKNGTVLSGSVVYSGTDYRVENNEQRFDIKRGDIVAMRSYQEQLTWQVTEERKRAPHFFDPWQGYLDAGGSATRGNADVATISVGLSATRTTVKDKLTANFSGLYARNSTIEPASVTADLRRGGIRYERNIDPKRFGFLSLDAESDALQRLELRGVGGLGFGEHVIKNPRNTFDVFAGATANRENFTHLVRLSGEALFSEESSHKLNSIFSFRQRIGIFPNLTDTGEYRVTMDSTAVTTLLRWLSWQVSVSDRYTSDPPTGTVKNDILFTTGLRFNLLPHNPPPPPVPALVK